MAEIKTPPIVAVDQWGNPSYTFTQEHSLADVARWIISEGGAEDVLYLLEEEIKLMKYKEANLLDDMEEEVLPWDNKPTGPIWVDFTPLLTEQLPLNKLVLVANLALNRLTLRDHGEIFYDAGVEVNMNFVPKEP